MKKYVLILIILLFCTLLIGCSNSKDSITPEMIQSVMSMTDGNKYVSIATIENESTHFSIMVELLFEPQSYSDVKRFTDAICEDCHRFFKENNIKRNIYVWGYRPKEDLTVMYGKTSYDKYSGKFEFKTVEELNL